MFDLINTILGLVKSGKSTIDEVMNDPKVNKEIDAVSKAYENELKNGNMYTKAARPTAIYLCLLIMFNDFILIDYVNTFFTLSHPLPHLLTDAKFKMLMSFLTALGLARSVLDKQGNWLENIFSKIKK